ncbi:hypothetical protein B0H66DRAFT_597801 [Apodospora peruviana]|uniref:Cysteine-rich transmembrane CYSTM domain-containing protein n=1 Tax=Apodospora peruviana TaxID=516989 RepID=A0AAE0ISB0_9PEZI|nr:hypothetical protein B0H66DRAFT_597801 [Apodospora peruviana]
MSAQQYYQQGGPPQGGYPQPGYPPQSYYPPQGQMGYPPPGQMQYPPQGQMQHQQPQKQSGGDGCLKGCLAAMCCCFLSTALSYAWIVANAATGALPHAWSAVRGEDEGSRASGKCLWIG